MPFIFTNLYLFTLQPVEGSNEFLKLLKSHKEKLEEGMRALKRRNEELEKEKAEGEKERENLLASLEQLRSRLTQVEHLIFYVFIATIRCVIRVVHRA